MHREDLTADPKSPGQAAAQLGSGTRWEIAADARQLLLTEGKPVATAQDNHLSLDYEYVVEYCAGGADRTEKTTRGHLKVLSGAHPSMPFTTAIAPDGTKLLVLKTKADMTKAKARKTRTAKTAPKAKARKTRTAKTAPKAKTS